jgi:hypothetical protein
VFVNPDAGILVDLTNPLHVALTEAGCEGWIAYVGNFFERMNNSMMSNMDVKIMDIINEKANNDEEFSYWVYQQVYGGEGYFEKMPTPCIDVDETSVTTPPGHSEVWADGGEYYSSNPRQLCSPPAKKHSREKNSTDSELSSKRVNIGERVAKKNPV